MPESHSKDLWTAVVTGGASGIGATVSRKLASRGINDLIAHVSSELGEKLAEELKSTYRVDSIFLRVDVSKEADVQKMIETVVQKWGRLDYTANEAGASETTQFEEHSITTDHVDRAFAVNQRDVWLCQKLEAEQMMTQEPRAIELHPSPSSTIKPQRGAIVNVSSITALTGMGFAAYAPTKHAVIGITQNGAFFYGGQGIRCDPIAPGGTVTAHDEGQSSRAI
ncbi:2 5-dichloro-2 5-cyclohexadiene-1 4-diol dehydrogenase [Fusarium beomiforme]|uniref:2 5-dichloro-2 5-cyclohexadiene-1 4-diol dehydrogenase n=1 Tax=Fusarium beomiforme TaxID=44412 RepID=A0A9P5AEJ8_9HYPO|nr:2 5-dichloro-2 5-cyclohexadiene-1 4-diol dehydrogenase [Fusarium beomiforme]